MGRVHRQETAGPNTQEAKESNESLRRSSSYETHHAVNSVLGKAAVVVGEGDLILVTGGLVARRHVQDTFGVDVERDLDLMNTARSGRNARQLELAWKVLQDEKRGGSIIGSRHQDKLRAWRS